MLDKISKIVLEDLALHVPNRAERFALDKARDDRRHPSRLEVLRLP